MRESLMRISSRSKATSESRRSRSAARRTRWMGLLTAKPRTWVSTKCAREMMWSVAALACLGQDLGNGTENGEVGMVEGQSMGHLLSKDSGAREWKYSS